MKRRVAIPKPLVIEVLTRCQRRCALCFALQNDLEPKRGQIAHIDKNSANKDIGNLVWLCLSHHDEYDSRHCQTRGILPDEIKQYRDQLYRHMLQPPQSQKVRWGPNDGLPAGISAGGKDGLFIPWDRLKSEIETRLLNQLGRHIPIDCSVLVKSLFGRQDWVVAVIDSSGNELANIWFGSDPDHNWQYDGLVRVGNAHADSVGKVWQVFQRYSDGTYLRIKPG